MLPGYHKDPETGVICQSLLFPEIKKPAYSKQYIENSYEKYGAKVDELSYMRLGFLLSQIPKPHECNLLDFGYGNGGFLKAAARIFKQTYGYDINGYDIPDKIERNIQIVLNESTIFENKFDVITFFDSLEHIPDALTLIDHLKTTFIMISVPSCNFGDNDEWFASWKHRRPNEHLYHFDMCSLIMFMQEKGYVCVSGISNFEDTIRVSPDNKPNIITGIFRKLK